MAPGGLAAFVGPYRSYNPLMGAFSFRVVLRDGLLVFISPSAGEEHMEPLPDGSFRIGEDPRSPERVRFDMVIGGKAFRACLPGGCLHRSFVE